MKKKGLRIGIMGGTFDPVHYGHLVTAEGARCEYELDHVLFLPSGKPPHKSMQNVSNAEHRYMMTVLAILTNPHFEVSRLDIDREGISYTIDALRSLQKFYGLDTELFFITGADAIFEIADWKDSDEYMTIAHFIAAARPGFCLEELPQATQDWVGQHGDRFHVLKVPAMAISSTEIRDRVKKGISIRYLVPEPVEHYIKRHNLYL